MNKKILTTIIFVICGLLSFEVEKYIYDPVGSEFKHWINQYLEWKGMLIKSLNKKLDTVYFYWLHNTAIAGKDRTYNPRFMGSIILYSIYGGITWDRDKLTIILSTLMCWLVISIYLIFKNVWIINKYGKYNLIIILLWGIPFYIALWWKIDDLQISYFLFFFWHYLAISENTKKHYLWHIFMIISWWFYRSEFVILYCIHALVNKFKRIHLYLAGIIICFSILISLNYFYKWEFWIIRDQFGYIKTENILETQEILFDSEQKHLEEQYKDYTYQTFSWNNNADLNKSGFINVALRYFRINEIWLYTRLNWIKNLMFWLSYISLFISIGWIFLLQKKYLQKYKKIYPLIISLLTFTILIYFSSYNPWEKIGEPRYIQSSYIRYSIWLIYLFWSLGIINLINKKNKIIIFLVIFISILEPIRFIRFGSEYEYYKVRNNFSEAVKEIEKKLQSTETEIIWIAWSDEKGAIFENNQNVFSYEEVPNEVLDAQINNLILKCRENNYIILFGAMYPQKISRDKKEILLKYFNPIGKTNWFTFYRW